MTRNRVADICQIVFGCWSPPGRTLEIAVLDIMSDLDTISVLVVEDEWLIAEDLKATLEKLGCRVLGPALSCAEALAIVRLERPDLAMLDTQLGQETCEVMIDECRRLKVPIVITSGHSAGQLPAFCEGLPAVGKPYSFEDVAKALQQVEMRTLSATSRL